MFDRVLNVPLKMFHQGIISAKNYIYDPLVLLITVYLKTVGFSVTSADNIENDDWTPH